MEPENNQDQPDFDAAQLNKMLSQLQLDHKNHLPQLQSLLATNPPPPPPSPFINSSYSQPYLQPQPSPLINSPSFNPNPQHLNPNPSSYPNPHYLQPQHNILTNLDTLFHTLRNENQHMLYNIWHMRRNMQNVWEYFIRLAWKLAEVYLPETDGIRQGYLDYLQGLWDRTVANGLVYVPVMIYVEGLPITVTIDWASPPAQQQIQPEHESPQEQQP